MDRLMYDSHMHTPLCKHAVGFPENYAEAAFNNGLRGIVITCHNPAPDNWAPRVRMDIEEYDQYLELVAFARDQWAGKIDVLLGLESDYVPGMESYLETLHAKAPLNYILGSIHPTLSDYRERFYSDDVTEYRKTYFEHLAMAAETGLFNALSHPDLVKNCFADQWNVADAIDDVCRTLDRVAQTETAMELNTSGQFKVVAEMNPGVEILKEMFERQIPVVLGSDAHNPERVACSFFKAFDILESVGYQDVCHFVAGTKNVIAIKDARASMKANVISIQ